MRVVMAPDKFRGTLSAEEAARAMASGWTRVDPGAQIREIPMADGGEGTLETVVSALGGRIHTLPVTGPLGDPVDASYGLAEGPEGRAAVVEMARASGLALVPPGERRPLEATTRGTGELIMAACSHRPSRVIVCIGGSATTDGGAGLAQAVGVRLLDSDGREIGPGGAALRHLATVDVSGIPPEVRGPEIVVASDVDNPLLGPHGAAATYGPQKGCSEEEVLLLERAMERFADVVEGHVRRELRDLPGAGAAGGLGAGLVAFLGARLRPGFEVVAESVGLGDHLAWAEAAVTGEGRFDRQTLRGKAPAGVLRMARDSGCRTAVICGQIEEGVRPEADHVYRLTEEGAPGAKGHARALVEDAAARAARDIGEEE